MSLPAPSELRVESLGECTIPSPLKAMRERFVGDDDRVLVANRLSQLEGSVDLGDVPGFEIAGARESIYFDPAEIACGVVTCGGLCPGINNVIRAVVLTLFHRYGVRSIYGFRYGYAGLAADAVLADSPGSDIDHSKPLLLTPRLVEPIHRLGGSFLGSSRGPQDLGIMVDRLEALSIRILFTIGGDGTLRGAGALAEEIARRGLKIAVIGIPKTIDNDIHLIEQSFGFTTAVDEARQAIVGAHAEARGALNGIGLVKLMGRHSGYITAHASLANSDVNFCLIPEVPFTLEGENGFLAALERRLRDRRHAVIVVAEGAGQELLAGGDEAHDASGNVKLKDIGLFLKAEIKRYLTERGLNHTVKYIDPSYIVRSLPAGSVDAAYCLKLGQHAVHAGMSGRTAMVVGYWNQCFTHVPIALATQKRKQVRVNGSLWPRVLEATGQPSNMVGT